MSRDELQRPSLEAALGDIGLARVELDNVAGWPAAAGASPVDPLAAEVWVLDPDLTQVPLVLHPRRGWVPPGGKVEPREMPREAARRELFEETGLEAELLARPAAVSVRSYHPEGDGDARTVEVADTKGTRRPGRPGRGFGRDDGPRGSAHLCGFEASVRWRDADQ